MKETVLRQKDLVKEFSKKLHIPYGESTLIVKSLFEVISEKVLEYDVVKINNFGTFTKKDIKSRIVEFANGCVRESTAYEKPTFHAARGRMRIYTQDDESVYWKSKHRRGKVVKEATIGKTSDYSRLLVNEPAGARGVEF